MNTTTTTAPAGILTEQSSMDIFTTSSALELMWSKSYKHMTPEEIEWFADGASEQVSNDVRTLSFVVDSTACMVSYDTEAGNFKSGGDVSNLLFNLHNQLNTIAGLASIAGEANYLARMAGKGGKP